MSHKKPTSNHLPGLPEKPVDRWVEPIARFLHVETAGGIVLMACTAAALVLANSPWSEAFLKFWKTPVGFHIGSYNVQHYLQHWINDGLMALFFFVVGLEVKREMVLGELRDLRRAALPIAAALGGMVLPALIYLALQTGQPGQRGWGIPMATDIAFVVGCMALLGPRVPHGLRVMLLSLAIVDDIGAVLVIAVGYTESLNYNALALGIAGILLIVGLTRAGVRNVGLFTVIGFLVWFAFHESGVHATIAGVILGLITPARSWVSHGLVADVVGKAGHFLQGEGFQSGSERYGVLRHVEQASREAISPLERLETRLHPWSSFVIMPIFALANAGVPLAVGESGFSVGLAVMLALVLGKPLGIMLFSFLAVAAGLAQLPKGVTWSMVAAGGCLAGIGFTMAMFIAGLALEGELLDTAKIGILAASVISAAFGMTMLARRPQPVAEASDELPASSTPG